MSSRYEREIADQSAVLGSVLGRQAEALKGARALWLAARRRFVVGTGSSRHVADYGVACAAAFGPGPAVLLPSPGAGVSQAAFAPGDVIVAVSQSGHTPALVHLADAATAAGALVLSVTNTESSPLQGRADLALSAGAGAETVVPATKSVTASMLLLRALAGTPRTTHVDALAASVDQLLRDLDVTGRPLPSVVVAGGFGAEPVADEVALKLAEVAAHLAVAETLVDYLHGPAAVPAPVLALLDPVDPNNEAVLTRPDVRAVTVAPTGDPTLDAIARVVAGQVLALRWAEAAGTDPDDPRGLRKVTLTA